MTEEEWRKIEGFPNYTISNLGRVCSTKREQAVILKARKNRYGYLQVYLCNENKKFYNKKVHRLVASAFISNHNDNTEVNHINGNKTDNNVSNLEWITHSENLKHAFATGLQSNAGIHNPCTHLTEAQVSEIYRLAHVGSLTQKEIGGLFGIKQRTVSNIKTRRSWKELTVGINIQSQKQIF